MSDDINANMPPMTKYDRELKAWGDAYPGGGQKMKRDWNTLWEIYDEYQEACERDHPTMWPRMRAMEEYLALYGTGETGPRGIIPVTGVEQ